MNIFYEEGGQFKVATVVQRTDTTYQVDTQHGKRAKVKANAVFAEFDTPADAFLRQAQEEAAAIDVDLLWEVCGEDEITADFIASEYFGGKPNAVQLAAVLIAVYAAPMYFYKKGKGIFKAAPQETLKQALAAIERKKQQEAQIEAWAQVLENGTLPEAVATDLTAILHAPDKQSMTYKAFQQAAAKQKCTPYELAKRLGAIRSLAQYLLDGFVLAQYPHGVGFDGVASPVIPDLPLAEGVQAFSIDDESTTEVDDALSVQDLGNGSRRVGIHIAVPSLAIVADSPLERVIFQRQSTAYYPGGKITMLPEAWIAAFSLDEQGVRPAVSIYFDVDADWVVHFSGSRVERVMIADNLRIGKIEPLFNAQRGLNAAEPEAFAHHHHLIWLHGLAVALQKQRDKYDPDRPPQYDYGIELGDDGKVAISRRERGSPIDTVVSEMMILANSTWAKMLDDADLPGMFRVQPPMGKVRMSTRCEPHSGMGVTHYGWFTSPLRRAADYINQRQLLSLLLPETAARYVGNDAMLFAEVRDFETTYQAYADFQRILEAYWSLVYIEQEGIQELQAALIREDLVRIDGMPLTARAVGIPFDLPPRTMVRLAVTGVDSEKQFIGLNYLNAVAA